MDIHPTLTKEHRLISREKEMPSRLSDGDEKKETADEKLSQLDRRAASILAVYDNLIEQTISDQKDPSPMKQRRSGFLSKFQELRKTPDNLSTYLSRVEDIVRERGYATKKFITMFQISNRDLSIAQMLQKAVDTEKKPEFGNVNLYSASLTEDGTLYLIGTTKNCDRNALKEVIQNHIHDGANFALIAFRKPDGTSTFTEIKKIDDSGLIEK